MAELAPDPLAAGESALATGDWDVARTAFESALAIADTPAARDGLGRSLWWIEGPTAAVAHRMRAYAGFCRAGDAGAAARVAVWLAHEYAVGLANPAAASGWTSRAAGLLQELPEGADHARLELVRGATALDPIEACRHGKLALEIARRIGDRDLEITALGRLGLAEVRVGAVESGMARMDEAMAATLGGETAALETLGQVCCDLIAACDQTGDVDRLRQWNRLLDEGTRQRGELPVLSFCGCCSAETLLAGGQVDAAERELARAVQVAQETGSRGRCVDPRSRLADMLVRQGRFEEAEQLLPGADGDGWTVRARAELQLARGEPGAAVVVLERRLRQIGEANLLAVTVLDLLVQARIAAQEHEAASVAAAALEALAEASGNDRVRAYAARARGRVDGSLDGLERALELFARMDMGLEVGRTRLDLARALRDIDRHAAIAEGRNAISSLHRAGAAHERDAAAALLRELGDESRPVASRSVDELTRREVEVLRLVGEGLTNAEIAGRLFISTKTAGNHVSSVLMKLGLRNRTQAGALARTHLGQKQGSE